MPYLNLDLDYFEHPKVVRLTGILGQDAALIPIRLWVYAGKYHPEEGLLEGYSKQEIESVVKWVGESGHCIDALERVNLISKVGESFQIHDWKDHAGHLAVFKKRAKTAAKKRWKKYATSIAKTEITNAPNLSYPNLTKPTRIRKQAGRPWPDDLVLSPELIDLGKSLGIDPHFEFEKARNHCKATGKQYVDYTAFLRNWFGTSVTDRRYTTNGHAANPSTARTCQERVQRGNFLKPCGEPSVAVLKGRPLCQVHKEYHDRRAHVTTA
jgi:hypothetical protein